MKQRVREKRVSVDAIIHLVLRAGMIVAAVLLALGVAAALARREPLPRTTMTLALPTTWRALLGFEPAPLVTVGLAALILTPFSRVAGTIVAYSVQKDFVHAVVGVVVMALMILSMLLGVG